MNYKNIRISFIIALGILSCASMVGMNNNKRHSLRTAVLLKNLEAVQKCIENEGTKGIDTQDEYGQTPLNLAAHQDTFEIVEYLIKKGASINLKDKNGETPLHAGCLVGNIKMVECLIENGASLDAEDNFGTTPLHIAVYGHNNSMKVITTLLTHLLFKTPKTPYDRAQAVLDLLAKRVDMYKQTALEIAEQGRRDDLKKCINEFENKAKKIQQRYLKQDIFRNLNNGHKTDTLFTGNFNSGWN